MAPRIADVESAFYFIFKTQDEAEKARERLASDGYSVAVLTEEGSEPWLVLRIQNMSEDEYLGADDRMEKLAASVGGVYDGAEREIEQGPNIGLPTGSSDDTLYYQCFFCGAAIAEEDPELRDVIFARPGAKDLTRGGIYACHSACAARAAHTSVFYMDPESDAE